MNKICPVCKKSNILELDPIETRKKLRELFKGISADLVPEEILNMVKELGLDQEVSESEKTFYSIHGKRNICQNCSFAFSDNDDYSEYLKEVFTPVSQSEYFDYIKSKVNEESYNFICKKSTPQKEYYLQVADQLIEEFEEVGLTDVNDDFIN